MTRFLRRLAAAAFLSLALAGGLAAQLPATAAQGSDPGAALSPTVADPTAAGSMATTALASDAPSLGAPARLVVFNRPILTFRGQFLGLTPDLRRQLATERIRTVLDQGGRGRVTATAIPQGMLISIDDEYVFVITPDDAATGIGTTLATLTSEAVGALTEVVAATREARDSQLLLQAGILAAAATVIYLLVLWVLSRIGRVLRRRTADLAQATEKLRVGGFVFMPSHRAVVVYRAIVRFAGWVLILLVTYEWLGYVLGRFPFTRPWAEKLNGFLFNTISGILISIAHALPDVTVVILIFTLAYWVNRLAKRFYDAVEQKRINVGWVDEDTAPASRRLTTIAVWLFALVMAYPYIPGSDTDAFKGLSVLAGLMVTVGASGIFGQAASGLILMYTRAYRPGEYVRIGTSEGTIVAMGMFTTRVRTGMGEELTIPNSTILTSVTYNYSRTMHSEGFVVDATVTIGYDTPWRQVHAMLIEAATRTQGILNEPVPKVFQTALADFYAEYRLVCHAAAESPLSRAEVNSALYATVQDVFNEHDVQIMSPHYVGDPAEPKVVRPAGWYAAPAKPPEA